MRKKLLDESDCQLNECRELFEEEDESDVEPLNEEHAPKSAFLKKMDAMAVEMTEEECEFLKEEAKVSFDVNNLVELTYKSFSLNEDLLNNNCEGGAGDNEHNMGVSDEDDTDL